MLNNFARTLALAVVASLAGCAQLDSYTYTDNETYVRPVANPAGYKRAAVLYFGYSSGSRAAQDDPSGNAEKAVDRSRGPAGLDTVIYSNALIGALSKKGVAVVERNRVADLIREQGLAQSELVDLSDLERVRQIGKLLKVDLLLKGSVLVDSGGFRFDPAVGIYYQKQIGVSLRGIDTKTGQVVWVDTAMVSTFMPPKELEDNLDVSDGQLISWVMNGMVDRFYRKGA